MIIPYLIKSTLCLVVLFGFYKIVLENKAMHQFKRYYLLASLIFALTIPLVTFTYTTSQLPDPVWIEDFAQAYEQTVISTPPVLEEKTNYLPSLLWSIYGIGVLVFGVRFALNLFRLKRKIDNSHKNRQPDFTLAFLKQAVVPHSFLRWIFLNHSEYQTQAIAPEVIAHEATHVRQKHSLDILFIEFLQVLFWFNPLFWITKKSITLNHEFLADQGAITNESNIAIYQNILLSYASSTHHTALESPFNYSSTKKRILMMSQTFSRKRAALSALILVPVIILCVFLFNNDIKAQSKQLAIEGEWLESKNELVTISIYKKSDTLWFDMGRYKSPINQEGDRFFVQAASGKHYIKSTENGNLMLDDVLHIPMSKSIKQSVVGSWKRDGSDNTFKFFLSNGGLLCDIYDRNGKPTRYYPNLEDEGVTFTLGYEWITFVRKGDILIDNQAKKYKLQTDYSEQFIQGAAKNGKKALVVEIENNNLRLNGKVSSLYRLQKDINAITQDWEETEYTDASPSFLFKNSDKEYLERLNEQFLKTKYSKANGGLNLLPVSEIEMESAFQFSSSQDHLKKMKNIGSVFYYNNHEISFEQALNIVNENNKLNISTPFPYSTPPQTFLSDKPIEIREESEKYKKGDTITFTLTDTGEKAYAIMDDEKVGTVIDKKPEDAGISRKELDTYNTLAKKYNKTPVNQRTISKLDQKLLTSLYQRMNKEQREVNEVYPITSTLEDAVKQELEKIEKLPITYVQNPATKEEIATSTVLQKNTTQTLMTKFS